MINSWLAVELGATVIALVAPRALRFGRRLGIDAAKDPDLASMVTRELDELDDPDPDGAQSLKVMALAHDHGFFVDASQDKDIVLGAVIENLIARGIDI